jgi:glutamyl-tRNA synthetase
MSPRLRFAPSPTGSLHVGNARTALVNWLIARKADGELIVRIEDTDAERSDAANERTILDDLRWLGLDWDEGPDVGGDHGPYRQSERTERYTEVVRRLLEEGGVYPCFETAEEMAALREAAVARGESLRFRGPHRGAEPAEAKKLFEGGGAALRFKVPDREVRFVDDLRGSTGLGAGEMSDFVVARADGSPTYNLAVVVDDHDMRVDRVVRGEDHLPNTPRQILLYEALGWQAPAFAHLPLVLGPDRSRLSKRHGATSVAEMRQGGILPEALCNFLALLGWSPPEEREVLRLKELMAAYDVADLSAANSVFDVTKLEWLNGQHMARLSAADLLDHAAPFLAHAGLLVPAAASGKEWWAAAVELVAVGARRLTEIGDPLRLLAYPRWASLVEAAAEIRGDDQATAVVSAFAAASRAGELASEEGYLSVVQQVKESTGAKGRGLFHPLRLAISGADSGPELKRLIPLLEAGAVTSLEPPVAGVAERIERVLNEDVDDAVPFDPSSEP